MGKKQILKSTKTDPGRITMGAMIRFKKETGRDVSELKQGDLSDMIMFVFCCTKSACNADKEKFDMTFDDFADSLDPESINDFYADMQDSQKKT